MIPFVDEELTGNPRYKITHSDNTEEIVSIDLVTPIAREGTAQNKEYFDSVETYINLATKYNVPTVTQTATPQTGSYIPSMSSATGGFEASSTITTRLYNPINSNASESWSSGSLTAGGTSYWQLKLDQAIMIKEIQVGYSIASFGGAMDIQASADGENWDTIESKTSGTSATITVSANKKYLYIRASMTATINSQSFTLSSIQITKWYGSADVNIYNLANHIVSYETGLRVGLKIPTNYVGGNVQVNIHSLGNKNVTFPDGYDIQPNQNVPLVYNGTEFTYDGSTAIASGGGGGGGTTDYGDLNNKPSINNVILSGNKAGSDLNLVGTGDIATTIDSTSTNSEVAGAKAVYDFANTTYVDVTSQYTFSAQSGYTVNSFHIYKMGNTPLHTIALDLIGNMVSGENFVGTTSCTPVDAFFGSGRAVYHPRCK